MPFTYKKLWKMLIDRDLTKEYLRLELGLHPATIAKMGKGEKVSMEVIEKLCAHFNCQPGDVYEYVREE